jgi:Flp pilus assembly protein TadG
LLAYLNKQFRVSRRSSGDRGSAPAEFVLVSALLVALVLAIIHVSLVAHTRTILQASAWEGARYASYYDTNDHDGAMLTERLIREALGDGHEATLSVRHVDVAGQAGVSVTVESLVPQVGLWSPGGQIVVEAAVPYEQPR